MKNCLFTLAILTLCVGIASGQEYKNNGVLNAVNINAPSVGKTYKIIMSNDPTVTDFQLSRIITERMNSIGFIKADENPDFFVVYGTNVQFYETVQQKPSGAATGVSTLANILGIIGSGLSARGGQSSTFTPHSPKGTTIDLYAKDLQLIFYKPSPNQDDYTSGRATMWQATSVLLSEDTDLISSMPNLLDIIFEYYPQNETNQECTF
jgi:hypothetical protein